MPSAGEGSDPRTGRAPGGTGRARAGRRRLHHGEARPEMSLKLDLHDVYNKNRDIDRALNDIIEEALRKKAKTVEIIPGKGTGQLKKRVLRFLDQKEIRAKYHRVEKDGRTSGGCSSTSSTDGAMAARNSPGSRAVRIGRPSSLRCALSEGGTRPAPVPVRRRRGAATAALLAGRRVIPVLRCWYGGEPGSASASMRKPLSASRRARTRPGWASRRTWRVRRSGRWTRPGPL